MRSKDFLLWKGIRVTQKSKAEQVEKDVQESSPLRKLKAILKALGPGLIAGASGDDPSGIGTYSQTGAQFGYIQLWTALFTFPLQATIQEICARIALQTGRGLAANIRKITRSQSSIFIFPCSSSPIPSPLARIWARWPPRLNYFLACRFSSGSQE